MMVLWCNCDKRREAEEKAAKYDALIGRIGGADGLALLLEGDCETCPAYAACPGCVMWEDCARNRAKWLLGGRE
jgi:hypothetical protein